MARLARIVLPDVPHHVTQRDNRRMPVFFGDGIAPPISIWSLPPAPEKPTE
jgi:REP element-mobilizing transposase RayT